MPGPAHARARPNRDGRCILELGYDQGPQVSALAESEDCKVVRIDRDLQGIERALTLEPVGPAR